MYSAIFFLHGQYNHINYDTYQQCLTGLAQAEEPIGIYHIAVNRFEWHIRLIKPTSFVHNPIYQATLLASVGKLCGNLYELYM